jgi:hypothetical protein
MAALLRCRRIAYRLLLSTTGAPGPPAAKPPLLPTFYLPGPNGALQAVTGSTPQIHRFEAEFAGRALVPPDPALALVDALLEDFGDEWLTKAMLHSLWTNPADIRKAGYRRVLLALEDHFRAHRFLMAARPGASDFPICGQLTQLVHLDPTSMVLAAEIACAWAPGR